MNFGMPYKGSKNKIAQWVVDQLPSAKHFYDLFGGGGAITHRAILSGKYEVVHYNELSPVVFKAFEMAVNGEFKNENRWISREEFHKLKDTDPYVNLCFSFGNNGRSYCYNPKIEPFKKALHYAICFNDFSFLEKLNVFIDNKLQGRLTIVKAIKDFLKIKRLELQSLESLERLQSLERLDSLGRLELSNLDYRNVKIEEDSVIYCDIPYKGADGYGIFNHDEFYNWCRNKNNIFISEYTMPNDFKVIAQKDKLCIYNKKNLVTTEKLFTV
jgi:site-specific DNA-adenine methylase